MADEEDSVEEWNTGQNEQLSPMMQASVQAMVDFAQNNDSGCIKEEPSSPDEQFRNYNNDNDDPETMEAKQNRRVAHSVAEQKRRDAIRKGYDDLQMVVPLCHQQNGAAGSQKPSKAVILQKTIDYIGYMINEKKKNDEELEKLRKEVMAFRIMKANYESIAIAHQNQPNPGQQAVPEQIKFNVFKQVMEKQFATFDSTVNITDFDSLSSGTFNWLEEYCQPQYFTESVLRYLRDLSDQGLLQS
ncbi:max-like protein X isoform X3 [Exaiptasia diaphana]|uniref:BHLH domain-containing protein n=1 Tax=Exaiptasia diaphana TaxID=2652724 RepID=A0A913WS24_EXADI|nr:max-like protein X isoform X3 [Exaiptasia diaphana]